MIEATAIVDHLVVAAPDLDAGIEYVEELLGQRAQPGGRHRRWGTHNAIVALESLMYIEIIAADPERERPETVTVFALDRVTRPRLVAWAARERDLESRVRIARDNGMDLGPILDGARERPDGSRLSWRLTDPEAMASDGLVPFFIDWLDSVHPATGLSAAGRLQELSAEHPDPAGARSHLEAIGLHMSVAPGEWVVLKARIRTRTRDIELR